MSVIWFMLFSLSFLVVGALGGLVDAANATGESERSSTAEGRARRFRWTSEPQRTLVGAAPQGRARMLEPEYRSDT